MSTVFVWLYLIVIGLLVSANKKKKRSQKQRQAGMTETKQTAKIRQAASAEVLSGQDGNMPDDPFEAEAFSTGRSTEKLREKETIHHQSVPLEAHMHTPEMGEEGTGTEGIDCCHEYMLGPENERLETDQAAQMQNDQAKMLLQGVIFSEILSRRPVPGRRTMRRS